MRQMFNVVYTVSILYKMFLSWVLYRPCSASLTVLSVTLLKFMSKQTHRILYIVLDYCARLRCSYFWLMTDTYKKLNNHKSKIKTTCCSNCCCCACCSCCCCRPDQRTNLFTLCFVVVVYFSLLLWPFCTVEHLLAACCRSCCACLFISLAKFMRAKTSA